MTENTTSPLASAISARVVQLAHESNDLPDTAGTALTRPLALVSRQVEEVAAALFTLKLEN